MHACNVRKSWKRPGASEHFLPGPLPLSLRLGRPLQVAPSMGIATPCSCFNDGRQPRTGSHRRLRRPQGCTNSAKGEQEELAALDLIFAQWIWWICTDEGATRRRRLSVAAMVVARSQLHDSSDFSVLLVRGSTAVHCGIGSTVGLLCVYHGATVWLHKLFPVLGSLCLYRASLK